MGSAGLEIGSRGARSYWTHSSTFSAAFWKMLGHKTFFTIILIFLNIANICKADDRSDEDTNDVDRNKRFFFISSSSTTSTVTTTTVCYSATAGAGACTGRKRRAMIEDTLQPVPTSVIKSEETEKEVESGQLNDPKDDSRDARVLLYWRTTTVTTTTTSYTATSTFATIACTPSSFTLNACG